MFTQAHALFMDRTKLPRYLNLKYDLRAALASGDDEWIQACRHAISDFLRNRASNNR